MSTKQRKIHLAARAIQRQTELQTARNASRGLRKSLIAWVYLYTIPGVSLHYGTRFSGTPETTLKDEPGSRLTPIAGFIEGKCVKSFAPDIPVEIPVPISV